MGYQLNWVKARSERNHHLLFPLGSLSLPVLLFWCPSSTHYYLCLCCKTKKRTNLIFYIITYREKKNMFRNSNFFLTKKIIRAGNETLFVRKTYLHQLHVTHASHMRSCATHMMYEMWDTRHAMGRQVILLILYVIIILIFLCQIKT